MTDTTMPAPPTRYQAKLEGEVHEVTVADDGEVTVDGRTYAASLATTSPPVGYSLLIDGASVSLLARPGARGEWEVGIDGRTHTIEVLDERQAKIREHSGVAGGVSGISALKAPMPGLVVQVSVEEGELVEAGATVIIVEAMKMENELRAPAAARVARVLVGRGDAVHKAQVLVEFSEVDGV